MTAACQFNLDGCDWLCGQCGRRVKAHGDTPPAAVCRAHARGLGDMVADGLAAVGITKNRVSALVGGDCGCAERQAALNQWGREYLGIGRDTDPGGKDAPDQNRR